MSKLPAPDAEGLRARYPAVFDRPASARLAMPLMLLGAFAIFAFGLVHLGFSPARMLSGLQQLGWITRMMIPPDPGSSLPLYLAALGETLSIALLGTTIAAFALPVSLWRQGTSCFEPFPISGPTLPRLYPRGGYADLGAGVDQRRWSWPVRRRAGDCHK